MSAQTKTKAQKAGKFLGISLFAFLMFFNIKFAIGDNSNSDIDLLGLKVSVSTNSTYASSSYCWWWSPWDQDCGAYAINCMCDIIVYP